MRVFDNRNMLRPYGVATYSTTLELPSFSALALSKCNIGLHISNGDLEAALTFYSTKQRIFDLRKCSD